MKKQLTRDALIATAKSFCGLNHVYKELFGVTDGKAVGTFIECAFQDYLRAQYEIEIGNAAVGLDLPPLETDIKVTSVRQPQSSTPFRSARQKVYGLGYNLLLFLYDKQDNARAKKAKLTFVSCAFIESKRTGDYRTTNSILEILAKGGNRDEIFDFLLEQNLPADDIVLNSLADEIMETPPVQGYMTISTMHEWRLMFGRVVDLTESIAGIAKVV